MGASDGAVDRLARIVNAGSPRKRWNLVIVAEGYRRAELAQFAIDARSFADRLLLEPPFTEPRVRRAINVYRLDVRSTQSGADKPRCADGGGTGAQAATYFDARFCFDGRTQRLLAGDSALAMKTVARVLPQWHQILMLVNDSERGGAGGQVGWFSKGGADWREVAIHEMGHSAFHLADEYDYGGPTRWPGGEPAEPNVSAEADPARVKWRALVTAGPAAPTRANPDCARTDPGPSPVAANVVGTFEGARYSHCAAYRPVWDCKMRTTTAPFCPVCSDVIVRTMAPFAKP
jgi:IgA Peptidase M64